MVHAGLLVASLVIVAGVHMAGFASARQLALGTDLVQRRFVADRVAGLLEHPGNADNRLPASVAGFLVPDRGGWSIWTGRSNTPSPAQLPLDADGPYAVAMPASTPVTQIAQTEWYRGGADARLHLVVLSRAPPHPMMPDDPLLDWIPVDDTELSPWSPEGGHQLHVIAENPTLVRLSSNAGDAEQLASLGSMTVDAAVAYLPEILGDASFDHAVVVVDPSWTLQTLVDPCEAIRLLDEDAPPSCHPAEPNAPSP